MFHRLILERFITRSNVYSLSFAYGVLKSLVFGEPPRFPDAAEFCATPTTSPSMA